MRIGRSVAVGLAAVVWFNGVSQAAELRPFTVADARNLPTPQLALELLGERLAQRIIEAKRYEFEGSSRSVPEFVEFFTQPELSSPVINGICRTDVITIEYDWVEPESANSSTSLKIARIAAKTEYKSFPEPPGDPGSEAYNQVQTAACATMKTASDAFRAPTGGDAQWLAAIHNEYANPASRFAFSCNDFADHSCRTARKVLENLPLNAAKEIRLIDCPKIRTRDQVDYCYRLEFDYPAERHLPDISDYGDAGEPEWIVTVFAGMRDGTAPVKIRTLHIEHQRKPYRVY